MTREEVIKVLSDIDHAWRNFSQEEYVALEIAIKALKQEPETGYWIKQKYRQYLARDEWIEYSIFGSSEEEEFDDKTGTIAAYKTICNKCNYKTEWKTKYCPECGAKMINGS